jgi:hypothetical protein
VKDSEFKFLIRRAEKTEKEILDWYRKNIDPNTHFSNPPNKEYDLVSEKIGNVEIKEDLLANDTGFYALEFEDASGKPSGIAATTAKDFVIVDKENVIFTKTVTLLFMIKECQNKRTIRMGYTTKDGRRAMGYLIPCGHLLNAPSPLVNVVNRWFPWR